MKSRPNLTLSTCARRWMFPAALALTLATVAPAHADTFGSGANTFTIDFVTIGNPGNGDDLGAGGGLYSSPYGGVGYTYRMGVTEVPYEWIGKAVNLGLAQVVPGGGGASRPATLMSWFESAAFVNWLNESTGHQKAYDLTWTGSAWAMNLWSGSNAWQLGTENLYRHKDAYYFLPSEDEWYKAAYHQNDGATANYWDYATGSNSIPIQEVNGGTTPGSAVYEDQLPPFGLSPTDVNMAGGLSPYGTMGQNGNVMEWQESGFNVPNDSPYGTHAMRGGFWFYPEGLLRASSRSGNWPDAEATTLGFRVASIPEPSTALLLAASPFPLLLRRRRR